MNNFFASVGSTLATKINTDNSEYIHGIEHKDPNSLLISWRPTDISELSHIIDGIDLSKNSQTKDINTKLLKDCLDCSKIQVCKLFNRILTDGVFPEEWKLACVVPIHKGGSKKIVNNYRPISLLPLIAKLFEKILHTRIYNFLDDSEFFSPCQSGFRPHMGTYDTLSTVLKYIYENFNRCTPVSSIFFDLSKAFDSIDHHILITKLKSSGINGSCLKLLLNYLDNRKQRCKVNGILSPQTNILWGATGIHPRPPTFYHLYKRPN